MAGEADLGPAYNTGAHGQRPLQETWAAGKEEPQTLSYKLLRNRSQRYAIMMCKRITLEV